jgi:hypothetical protein
MFQVKEQSGVATPPVLTPWQSPSLVHDLGHASEQMPWQQSCPWSAQSEDVVQALGQVVPANVPPAPASLLAVPRHRPVTLGASAGSRARTVVQHSGDWVGQSALVAHVFGHELRGVQMLWL